MKDETTYVNGIKSDKLLKSNIEDVFFKSTRDLEWLSPDDIVLLKPALNSHYPYPSTTHPQAVQVISRILTDKGAKVVVGDQSGIRSVLHHPGGVLRGSTRDNFIKASKGTADEENFISFEEEGWEEGFYHYKSSKTPSWPDGFYLTHWIKKADHIISLPRLSTHTQAGATLGFKNMVGCLRDDSRLEFHTNGPYNFPIKNGARGSGLKSVNDHSGTFFEKIVEISDALREKLRITLFVATQAQTTFGPNRQLLEIGKLKIAKAYVSNLKPGLVFASVDPVATESFALAILKYLRISSPILPKTFERLLLLSKNNTNKMDKTHVIDHPYIQHSMKLGFGEIASEIEYENVSDHIQQIVDEILNST
ncbi:MAG: DUF362 domain-containing protein [Methanobacterium sp.]|nr:DUF362 domain-containing protein [Methanobacterium sp.]